MQLYMGTMGALPFSAAVRKLQRSVSQLRSVDSRSHAPIVITILCNIPYPRESLVTTLFDDLEVADLDTRHREVRNLKLHRNWRSLIDILLCTQTG